MDRIEEMSIPSDLEDKLAYDVSSSFPTYIPGPLIVMTPNRIVRGKLNTLIEQWQRICILAERIIKRREAAAVRTPPAFRRTYLPTHFALPIFFSPSSSPPPPTESSSSIMSGPTSNVESLFGLHPASTFVEQGDLSRLTNTLRAVTEVNEHCWRGDDCELSNGVRSGLEQVAAHTQRHSEMSELRVGTFRDMWLWHLVVDQEDRRVHYLTRPWKLSRFEEISKYFRCWH